MPKEKSLEMQIYDCHKMFYNFKKTLIRSAKVFKTVKIKSFLGDDDFDDFFNGANHPIMKMITANKSLQEIDQFEF